MIEGLAAVILLSAGQGSSGSQEVKLVPVRRLASADKDAIQEAVIREQLTSSVEVWCLDRSVSERVFKRLTGVKVARDMKDCSEPISVPASSPSPSPTLEPGVVVGAPLIPHRYRRFSIDSIGWLPNDRVQATTTACMDVIPCSRAWYHLELRKGRWMVVEKGAFGVM